jgi:hypothetical protein
MIRLLHAVRRIPRSLQLADIKARIHRTPREIVTKRSGSVPYPKLNLFANFAPQLPEKDGEMDIQLKRFPRA